ncbi:MAG TPA: ligase-associated DNA damage response exonuclease, partial [Gemmataceae bacterium]|nr:ligase-associated DNA damage response exonuclease [Gemmataceae bacterium]
VITHAHADHARPGSGRYMAAAPGAGVLRARLGDDAVIDPLPYGQPVEHNGVRVSLHPAGHILGSAQVRMEHRGEVWVVTGDYKLAADSTCATFEPIRCHELLTESTFGLPVYRWAPPQVVFAEINAWWRANAEAGKASLLYGYALGKAQRLLSGLDPAIGPIYLHGAVERMTQEYRAAGVALPPTQPVSAAPAGTKWAGAIILAPPLAHNSAWTRRFVPASTAMASGWMRVRGARRRRAVDRGFVLSDHVDWPGLHTVVKESGAEHVRVTHGFVETMVRRFRELGLDAIGLKTAFEGEADEPEGEA